MRRSCSTRRRTACTQAEGIAGPPRPRLTNQEKRAEQSKQNQLYTAGHAPGRHSAPRLSGCLRDARGPGSGSGRRRAARPRARGGHQLRGRPLPPRAVPRRPETARWSSATKSPAISMRSAGRSPAFSEGDRVVAITRFGGYSDTVVVPAAHAFHFPDALSDAEAAAVPGQLPDRRARALSNGGAHEGETVLIHNAGGGVGIAATQLARLREGARDRHGVRVQARRAAQLRRRAHDRLPATRTSPTRCGRSREDAAST